MTTMIMPTEINLTPTATVFEIPADSPSIAAGRKASSIFARSWGEASQARTAAVLVHGLGAHSGWFEALARRLKVKGIFCVAYDQCGFGKRKEEPVTSYQDWVEDLKLVFRYVQNQWTDCPVFLFGNSMGAMVALATVNSLDACGLVLFSPGFDGHQSTFGQSFRLKTWLTALISPQSEVALPYKCELVTRLENVCRWLEADPDRRFTVPASMLADTAAMIRSLPAAINTPAIMFTAGMDKIVCNQTATKAFSRLSAPKKHRRHLADAWHDLMFDPEIDRLVLELSDWVESLRQKHVARRS